MVKMLLLSEHKPMVCSLFTLAENKGPGAYFPSHDGDELDLAFQLLSAATGGRVAELSQLLGSSSVCGSFSMKPAFAPPAESSDTDPVHLPFKVWNTSLLYQAASQGQLPVVRALLNSKHRVERGNHFGTSPVEIAAMRNHGEVTFELLTHGAELTLDAIAIAAQWNAFSSLAAMYCAGQLGRDRVEFALEIAQNQRNTETVDILTKMLDVSPIELAAETMNLPALKLMCGRTFNTLPTHENLKKSLVSLNKSRLKLVRPLREFRECKDTILAGQKLIVDLTQVFIRFQCASGKSKAERILPLVAPAAFKGLFEMLGLLEHRSTKSADRVIKYTTRIVESPESLC